MVNMLGGVAVCVCAMMLGSDFRRSSIKARRVRFFGAKLRYYRGMEWNSTGLVECENCTRNIFVKRVVKDFGNLQSYIIVIRLII